jgi:hypothetical protein
METYNSHSKDDEITDSLWRIDQIADWLKHEAQSLEEPPERPKSDVSVRRYRIVPTATLHRRPMYLLRGK